MGFQFSGIFFYMSTVHLIDASPYIFRAYFSLPSSITDADGGEAHAVYGFTTFLLKYIDDEDPTHVAVAFDESLTTSFRNEIYPDYKAQRELPPPELEAQLASCQDVARALGMVTLVSDRYEADDLVGTLCRRAEEAGHDVVIVSPDKDLAQFVGESVQLYDFARGNRYGIKETREKFGVNPGQIIDWIALAGDSVDNIPGVRGIGPKTAVVLLEEFEDLDAIYKGLDRIPGLSVRGAAGIRDRLEKEREMAFLSRELATIALDAPVEEDVEALLFHGADKGEIDPLFDRLGFGRIRERISHWCS